MVNDTIFKGCDEALSIADKGKGNGFWMIKNFEKKQNSFLKYGLVNDIIFEGCDEPLSIVDKERVMVFG